MSTNWNRRGVEACAKVVVSPHKDIVLGVRFKLIQGCLSVISNNNLYLFPTHTWYQTEKKNALVIDFFT